MTEDGRATAVDHVGIAVEDADEAAGLFSALLGVDFAERGRVEDEGVDVAMLPVGESRIELLEPVGDDSPIRRFLDREGEGIHQLAIRVDDIEAAVERAEELGVRVLGDVRTSMDGMRVTFLHPKDCHGVLVELVQRD